MDMQSFGGAQPLLYRVDALPELIGLGRSKIYELIATGELRTVKVGRRRLVPAEALADFVARLGPDSEGGS